MTSSSRLQVQILTSCRPSTQVLSELISQAKCTRPFVFRNNILSPPVCFHRSHRRTSLSAVSTTSFCRSYLKPCCAHVSRKYKHICTPVSRPEVPAVARKLRNASRQILPHSNIPLDEPPLPVQQTSSSSDLIQSSIPPLPNPLPHVSFQFPPDRKPNPSPQELLHHPDSMPKSISAKTPASRPSSAGAKSQNISADPKSEDSVNTHRSFSSNKDNPRDSTPVIKVDKPKSPGAAPMSPSDTGSVAKHPSSIAPEFNPKSNTGLINDMPSRTPSQIARFFTSEPSQQPGMQDTGVLVKTEMLDASTENQTNTTNQSSTTDMGEKVETCDQATDSCCRRYQDEGIGRRESAIAPFSYTACSQPSLSFDRGCSGFHTSRYYDVIRPLRQCTYSSCCCCSRCTQ